MYYARLFMTISPLIILQLQLIPLPPLPPPLLQMQKHLFTYYGSEACLMDAVFTDLQILVGGFMTS